MFAVQRHTTAKTANQEPSGRTRVEKGGEGPVQVNPLWFQLATHFPFGRTQNSAAISPSLQPKLIISQPGDPYEQEADRIAEQMMRMPEPALQRTCATCATGEAPCSKCEGKKRGLVQRKAVHGSDSADGSVPDSFVQELGSGQVLAAPTRLFMESRFGHDFSQVRMHTDSRAAESAQAVNALAYTVGKAVVFGAGQYAPTTGAGQRLLAHELTHVVQQRTGRMVLARQPAPQPTQKFETWVAVLSQTDIEKWAGEKFWLRRIGHTFDLVFVNETSERFKDEEERDAVLAALWRVRPDPSTLSSKQVQYVQIPSLARSQKKQPGELLYRFVFSRQPDKKTPDNKPKGRVEIHFEAVHPTSVVAHAPTPPSGYDPESASLGKKIGKTMTALVYHHEGFPQGDEPQYWEQHPDEKKQLFYWIEKQGRSFEQIVITRTTEQKGKVTAVRERPFLVRGSKDDEGRITGLSIEFLGAAPHLSQTWLPADYHSKDAADALLQEIQEQPDKSKNDRLGKVTLGTIPKEEAFPLKFMIWSYFTMGTRNAEVDMIVTITGTKKRVFYTLRFRQNNDVDVERIGEEGQDAKLDPNRLDIARVHGFESNADDPKKLKSWLRKRYPYIKPVGHTVAELRDSANKSLQAEAGTPVWFKENYHIYVLDKIEGKKRLEKLGLREEQTDMETFTAEELKLAELSLEPMSENVLSLLKETRLARQKLHITYDKEQRTFVPRPSAQGITYTVGSQNLVVIFDAAMTHTSFRFLGGTSGVRPVSIMTFTHELGHVVGNKTGATAKFNKFVEDKGIQPFTPYAEAAPKQEFFAEAFYLYETDPEWLRSSHPEVFAWFETLSKTGKPPVKKQ